MKVLTWVREGVWEAAVDSARAFAPDAEHTLIHVASADVEGVIRAGFGGLLGRHHPAPVDVRDVAMAAGEDLLAAAAARIGTARTIERTGRVEREVVFAAEGFDLLVVSRDGDRARLGPHSLGHATRFVVDHAPCPVLLVWPEGAPGIRSMPPPPPH